MAVVGCHIFNFLVLAADDADIGLLDLLLKPVKLWIRAVQDLPTRLWVTDTAACGVTAVLMSVLVIGGIPYERLWDWGFKEPPKQDLMGAVMNQVKKLDRGKGSEDLEKSVKDFAGDKDFDAMQKTKVEPPKPRTNVDCVIVGYLLDRDGLASTLLLGTANRGQLVLCRQREAKAGRQGDEGADEDARSGSGRDAVYQGRTPTRPGCSRNTLVE